MINRSAITDESTNCFFKDFQCIVQKEIDERNIKIRKLVEGKQSDPPKTAKHKDKHPLHQSKVYQQMCDNCREYEELMKLSKFSLLITPSTENVEKDFSILTMILTELDKIMQLILIGLQNFDDNTWNSCWWLLWCQMQKNTKLYFKLFLELEIFVVLTFNLTIKKKN